MLVKILRLIAESRGSAATWLVSGAWRHVEANGLGIA